MSTKAKRLLDISLKGAYLVGLPEVLTELGFPDDFGKILHEFHKLAGKELLVGKSTLRNAKHNVYSERTIKKLIEPFGIRSESIKPQVDTTDKLFERAFEVQSPMLQWWGLKSFSDEVPEYELVWQYIEKRIRNDIEIREALSDGEALSEVTDPNLRAELSRIGQLACALCNYKEDLTEQQLNQLSAIASEMDFYFGLFAHFEVGHKKVYALEGCDVLRRSSVAKYLKDVERTAGIVEAPIRNCFEGFLWALCEALGKVKDADSSWRKLARHIEQPSGSSRAEELKNQQYKVLKHWRKGGDDNKKRLPSDKSLYAFLKSVNDSSEGVNYLFLQAKISMFFDRKIKVWHSRLLSNDLFENKPLSAMYGRISFYEDYYDRCVSENWPA